MSVRSGSRAAAFTDGHGQRPHQPLGRRFQLRTIFDELALDSHLTRRTEFVLRGCPDIAQCNSAREGTIIPMLRSDVRTLCDANYVNNP